MKQLSSLLSIHNKESSSSKPKQLAVLDEKTVFFLFSKIVDEQYGKRGRRVIFPSKYDQKILLVKVASPLWAQELIMERFTLCNLINQAIGEEILLDIRVIHGLSSEQ